MNDDESPDLESLASLIDFLIDNGVHGIWVNGTTGEFPCFDASERAAIVRRTVATVAGRVPIIAGIGDCSTRLAIHHGRLAAEAGVDAIALTPPYYYVTSQSELLDHFRRLRAEVDAPLMVYNIPQTVKVKLDVSTMLQLADEGTVMGLKDSQNDLDWFRQVMIGARRAGKDIRGFLGTQALIDAGLLAGAHGAIPSTSNIAPRACVGTYEAARRGDMASANLYQERVIATRSIASVVQGSTQGAILAGMKSALKLMGVIKSARVSGPFRTASADEEARIGQLIEELELSPAASAL
jgi:4-hydroxy-tetrahydrodipicolinate synthase